MHISETAGRAAAQCDISKIFWPKLYFYFEKSKHYINEKKVNIFINAFFKQNIYSEQIFFRNYIFLKKCNKIIFID